MFVLKVILPPKQNLFPQKIKEKFSKVVVRCIERTKTFGCRNFLKAGSGNGENVANTGHELCNISTNISNNSSITISSFRTNCTEKTVGFSGIRTQIVGIKGEHADHLTTTTTRREEIYLKILFHPSVRPRRLLMRPFDFPMPMASHSE